jgi:peroxiredoxin
MSRWLWAAGLYNICWAVVAIRWPSSVCHGLGLDGMIYPEIWQYVGLLIGAYGLAYIVAASAPLRHWPVVFVGLLAKIAGPIGFVRAATAGRLPWHLGLTVAVNDLIWWIPFTVILIRSYQRYLGARRIASPEIQEFALRLRTNTGSSLFELSNRQPLLVFFLRHTGCPFCRESLTRLAKERRSLEESGTGIVLIHMSADRDADRFLSHYHLEDLPRISDRNRALYRAFGLRRGNLWQIVGPPLWARALGSIFTHGQSLSRRGGDLFQMPGLFLLYGGHVVRSFIHQTAGDRPDFVAMAQPGNWAGNQA